MKANKMYMLLAISWAGNGQSGRLVRVNRGDMLGLGWIVNSLQL